MKPMTRRRFMEVAVLGAAGASAAPAQAQPAPSRPAEAEAKALAEIARLRFGKHLNEEQMKSVQQRLTRSLANSESLRRVSLENGHEPAFVFVPEE